MNGPLAQLVALACHGNAYVKNGNSTEFFPSNSTCQFCDSVRFINLTKSWLGKFTEKEVAKNPDDWIDYVASRNGRGFRLVHSAANDPKISDRNSAGFVGGGGTWAIEILLPNDMSEYWQARWEVWNQNAPDQKIWRVTYGPVSLGKTIAREVVLANVTAGLTASLEEIHAFSKRNNCVGFTQCFEKALDTIVSGNRHGYHRDLSPEGILSKNAESILDACQSAWVFGGMGSWNDMGFEGDRQLEYERVSDQLFDAINSSIVTAVNSSGERSTPGTGG